jgi:hypothetical protein
MNPASRTYHTGATGPADDQDTHVTSDLKYATVSELWLDPTNPRIGRRNIQPPKSQGALLKTMHAWNLEELAVSFLESGFWTQEALIVVREKRGGKIRPIVVEGNRRLAALKTLHGAVTNAPPSPTWEELSRGMSEADELFTRIPYLEVERRADVDAYIGFRHVTGIKQWDPAEKAGYIARLVEERDLSFDEIRRAIGSKTPTVRRNYIAFRLMLQLEDAETAVPPDRIEQRFSVLYLSLRESAVQEFLGLSQSEEPARLRRPVASRKAADLEHFAVWLFGTKTRPPLFNDSRLVGDFAHALASKDAVRYLKSAKRPSLDQALRVSGLALDQVLDGINSAAIQIEQVLSRVHFYDNDPDVVDSVSRLAQSSRELFRRFGYALVSTE